LRCAGGIGLNGLRRRRPARTSRTYTRAVATPTPTASRVSPARRVAFTVVRGTFEDGAHTDRALRAEAARAGLEGRELAFATRLAYETVQRRRTLGALIAELAGRDVARLAPG